MKKAKEMREKIDFPATSWKKKVFPSLETKLENPKNALFYVFFLFFFITVDE